MSELFTIGFTQKSAKEFFELLEANSIELLADIRLNNTSQLAGFTKARDLGFFLGLFDIDYEHWAKFAPPKEIFKKYKKDGDWVAFETAYRKHVRENDLIVEGDIEKIRCRRVCLLCSEATAENCHRRLLAEMIRERAGDIEITQL